jgi:hypothetical protein
MEVLDLLRVEDRSIPELGEESTAHQLRAAPSDEVRRPSPGACTCLFKGWDDLEEAAPTQRGR